MRLPASCARLTSLEIWPEANSSEVESFAGMAVVWLHTCLLIASRVVSESADALRVLQQIKFVV